MENKLITESRFNDIAQKPYVEMRSKVSYNERYELIDPEELTEYMWLKPSVTFLKYDIFVDDGGAYIRGNHPLLIFVRNGVGRECDDFIPISVSNDPKILNVNMGINISVEDMFEIKQFIINNRQLLIDFSNSRMLPDKFVESLRLPFPI